MKNIAVFASGRGTNFSVICRAVKKGLIKANLALLVCDNPRAGVIRRAKNAGVKITLVQDQDCAGKKEFEQRIIKALKENRIDLVVLAGFMRILSADFVRKYKGRILNIHPALLPSFKGAHGIKDAFDYGVKATGVTVHFVDDKMDHGPIILQEALEIGEGDTLKSLEERIHCLEHKIYPQAVKLFVEGRLKVNGRRVRVL